MYKKEDITLREIFEKKLTKEPSVKALRTRADDKILVRNGLGNDGRTRLYDKQLSIVRLNAAKNCKNLEPSINWETFKRSFDVLDSQNPTLNNMIINALNEDSSIQKAVELVEKTLMGHFRQNGHIE